MRFFPSGSRRAADIGHEAAGWLARRDRGLTPKEQDAYLQWLREDERHAAAVTRAEKTLGRVMKLTAWQREHSADPNPDLLKPASRRRNWVWSGFGLAAAAAVIAIGVGTWRRTALPAPTAGMKNYLVVNERRLLPDGSRAEVKNGSVLDVRYTASERRVRLTGGEAEFSVMKDPMRPFLVEAHGIAVRALGTVFNVKIDGDSLEVLVTEGRVRVASSDADLGPGGALEATPSAPVITAGQKGVVPFAGGPGMTAISDLPAAEIQSALAWQAPHLQFDETPLTEAIAEFNRRNSRQLVLGDPALGELRVGGTFRADNVDAFVRLLGLTLGVRAETRDPTTTVLWRDR